LERLSGEKWLERLPNYNLHVLKPIIILLLSTAAFAQGPEAPKSDNAKQEEKKPEVRVNMLNVCTPSEAEQQEIKAALAKIPPRASFQPDFEISRGRTTMENAAAARYLRLRRELDPKTGFSTAQYSISTDTEKTMETLVMKLANPKDLLMITLEDRVTAGAPASSLLDVDTPVSRISLERFGKPGLVLAHCENVDQAAYTPLFTEASKLFAAYRKSLGLRGAFRSDLAWLVSRSKQDAPKPAAPKTEAKPEEKQ
jgi:hypothetical protein